jgi:hypothetical protein
MTVSFSTMARICASVMSNSAAASASDLAALEQIRNEREVGADAVGLSRGLRCAIMNAPSVCMRRDRRTQTHDHRIANGGLHDAHLRPVRGQLVREDVQST